MTMPLLPDNLTASISAIQLRPDSASLLVPLVTPVIIADPALAGSTLVGYKIQEAVAKSNLKDVTLELGGKCLNIVFDDVDLEQAISWSTHGILCVPALPLFCTHIKDYIASDKSQGATVQLGGDWHGMEGFWIQPTIFTDSKPDMRILREKIFGLVGVVIKFLDEEVVFQQVNDTEYGLASAVFSHNIDCALKVAHRLQAIPFGGLMQSGIGCELGEYALHSYTNVKVVHINLGLKI
ncbi:Aldehyde/histidinol dehydrogenase [Vararia minispora EC-137]|uniref:Aldehyde/histidinol dehydrogenase n=1 Tax=Vararia minispora EC-137 TaxID=1314806 RepID=A0ACB8Q4R9_9AGAM|nr:Aldehyde/histidinol dehydrogenase [Vararia minispora EC-137]